MGSPLARFKIYSRAREAKHKAERMKFDKNLDKSHLAVPAFGPRGDHRKGATQFRSRLRCACSSAFCIKREW